MTKDEIPVTVCCGSNTQEECIKQTLNYLNRIKEKMMQIETLIYDDPADELRNFRNIAAVRKYSEEIMWSGKRISEYTVNLERDLIEVGDSRRDNNNDRT